MTARMTGKAAKRGPMADDDQIEGAPKRAIRLGKRFWMICGDPLQSSAHNPTKVFTTEATARSSAEMLARSNPNRRFYLLEAVDYVETSLPPTRWGSDEA